MMLEPTAPARTPGQRLVLFRNRWWARCCSSNPRHQTAAVPDQASSRRPPIHRAYITHRLVVAFGPVVCWGNDDRSTAANHALDLQQLAIAHLTPGQCGWRPDWIGLRHGENPCRQGGLALADRAFVFPCAPATFRSQLRVDRCQIGPLLDLHQGVEPGLTAIALIV